MIWLSWRQSRLELLTLAAALATFASLMIVNGMGVTSAFHADGLASCVGHDSSNNCQRLEENFRNTFGALGGFLFWFNFLPLLAGVLLAAPFITDLEKGTYRLVWTQGITRGKWTRVKLLVTIALAAGAGLILIGVMSWWFAPILKISSPMQGDNFDLLGTAPLGYSIYALCLCLALGTVIGRAAPAIGLSLIGYVAARVPIASFLRQNYLPPVTQRFKTVGRIVQNVQDWQISSGFLRNGRVVSDAAVNNIAQKCSQVTAGAVNPSSLGGGPKPGVSMNGVGTCMLHKGVVQFVTYQPASRFWTFQAIETGIFLAMSAILLAVTVLWIRYRVS